MKDSKYIELLRHYLTEKIDDSVEEISNSQDEMIVEIISTVFSALISGLLAEIYSNNATKTLGSYISLVILLSTAYFVFRELFSWILKQIRFHQERKSYKNTKLSFSKKKKLIAKFDNIACDYLIAAYDSLTTYIYGDYPDGIEKKSIKEFYLYEAFYYYKKSIDITHLLLLYKSDCVGCSDGVAKYRIVNVFNSLNELKQIIDKYIKEAKDCNPDLAGELSTYEKRFISIENEIKTLIENA